MDGAKHGLGSLPTAANMMRPLSRRRALARQASVRRRQKAKLGRYGDPGIASHWTPRRFSGSSRNNAKGILGLRGPLDEQGTG